MEGPPPVAKIESSEAEGEALTSDPVTPTPLEQTSDIEADSADTRPEHTQAVSDRLEARKFSKEHSQFYRDRLAGDIKAKRANLATFLERQEKDIQGLETYRQKKLDYLSSSVNRAETDHAKRSEYAREFDEFKTEVATLESELESIKSSWWKRLTRKDRLVELEDRKSELDFKSAQMYEPDRAEISRLYMEIARQKGMLAEEERNERVANRVQEIREHSFFVQDSQVTESKGLIKDFYRKNLEIKREDEENPLARDVAENSRRNGVLIRHGVPDPDATMIDDWSGNNSVINTKEMDASQRLKFAAAVEPALSTHTKAPLGGAHMQRGFIVGGGEITVAHKSDLFSYASSLDKRNPKYDENLASSRAPNIQQGFDQAVAQAGNNNERAWNEIIVEHPKFSAVYVTDNGEYGQKDESGYNKFYKKAKWALEQARDLGMPAVVMLDSERIVNIATDEEVTQEQLLEKPLQYSVQEREQLFASAEGGVPMQENSSNADTSSRLERLAEGDSSTPEMDEYKRANRDAAVARLELLEAERQANRRRIVEEYGLKD